MPQVNKPSINEIWTQENQTRALSEGWGIFDNGCFVEIQRHDAPADGSKPIFDGDASAYDFVYSKAGTDPFYTLALLHINAANGVKERIGAPTNDIMTMIDGSKLNLPWKVSQKIPGRLQSDYPKKWEVIDINNMTVAVCFDPGIAATIREVVNAARDPSSITMTMETFMKQRLEIKSLRERVRRAEAQLQPEITK
jgi:hypothetical protein